MKLESKRLEINLWFRNIFNQLGKLVLNNQLSCGYFQNKIFYENKSVQITPPLVNQSGQLASSFIFKNLNQQKFFQLMSSYIMSWMSWATYQCIYQSPRPQIMIYTRQTIQAHGFSYILNFMPTCPTVKNRSQCYKICSPPTRILPQIMLTCIAQQIITIVSPLEFDIGRHNFNVREFNDKLIFFKYLINNCQIKKK